MSAYTKWGATLTVPMSDDGGEQQAAYCDAVAAMVTCDPAELIVDTWLDEFKLYDANSINAMGDKPSPVKFTAIFRLASLRHQLLYVLRANCDELEQAENAARLEGAPSFSEWLEEERS